MKVLVLVVCLVALGNAAPYNDEDENNSNWSSSSSSFDSLPPDFVNASKNKRSVDSAAALPVEKKKPGDVAPTSAVTHDVDVHKIKAERPLLSSDSGSSTSQKSSVDSAAALPVEKKKPGADVAPTSAVTHDVDVDKIKAERPSSTSDSGSSTSQKRSVDSAAALPVEKKKPGADVAPTSAVTHDVDVDKIKAERPSSSSDSSSSTSQKRSVDSAAALPVEKTEPGAGIAPAPADAPLAVGKDKIKAEGLDKEDSPAVTVVEPAEQPQDLPAATAPVKKFPMFVPVEIAGAYHPDNFYKPEVGGFVAAPAAPAPHRSVVHPWYQLVSAEVPILTLYPGDADESYRGAGMPCAEPSLRYIHGAGPVIYTGPAAAAPYAANQFAAASLANMGSGANPNPYGTHVPYFRFSHVPSHSAPVDLSGRSNLTPLASKPTPVSPLHMYPGSPYFNPYARQISSLDSLRFYTADGKSQLHPVIYV